jgi:HEAT repeat protein
MNRPFQRFLTIAFAAKENEEISNFKFQISNFKSGIRCLQFAICILQFPIFNSSELAAGEVAAVAADHAHMASAEDKLIEVLKSKAPAIEKNKACRDLKTIGTKKSIPALASLLTDKDLSHPACMALESMPYREAGAAIRAAAAGTRDPGSAAGRVRSGLIDSLGERRDAAAVPVIAPSLDDSDQQVVAAAAWALGKIGTSDAAAALDLARDKQVSALADLIALGVTSAGVRREAVVSAKSETIGQGLVLCARNLLKAGKTAEAAGFFAKLSGTGEPSVVRAAALAGSVRAAGPKLVEVVRGYLAGNDELAREAAAGALPELSAGDLAAVAAGSSKLPAPSQVALLSAIRIRGDRSLLPFVLDALAVPTDEVGMAAIRALGSVGDASALPRLLPLAVKESPLGEAARKSIESLAGKNIDSRILAALRAEKDIQRRVIWIDVISSCRSTDAAAVLLEEARYRDPIVRRHAMAALAELAAPRDLPGLIAGVLAAEQGPERDEAERAVVRAAQQVENPKKRAEAVLAAIDAAPGDHLVLLPLAARFGGSAVADRVQKALAESDSRVRETGLRALCNWPDASVAEQLLKLTESAAEPADRTMTLRAYTRVVSLPAPGKPTAKTAAKIDARRLAGLKRAMDLAQNDEERRYVLERAGAVRLVETLRFVLSFVDQPAVAEAACKAVADLAHHRELRDPNKTEFRAALEKVLHTSKERLILERCKRYAQAM